MAYILQLAMMLAAFAAPFVLVVAITARMARVAFPATATVAAPFAFAMLALLTGRVALRSYNQILPDVTFISLCVASLTATPAIWFVTRRFRLLLIAPAASLFAAAAFHIFERGTHGDWYVQSEGAAMLMATAVSAAIWHGIVATGLLGWARTTGRRERRFREGRCPACGYDLAGLPRQRCPECGRSLSVRSQ